MGRAVRFDCYGHRALEKVISILVLKSRRLALAISVWKEPIKRKNVQ